MSSGLIGFSQSMAFSRTALLSHLLILIAFFSPTSSSSSRAEIHPSDSEKVSLGLYYESLCPYSANFIVNYLVDIFQNDLISIVDLNVVPWGNARIRPNNTFTCQMIFSDPQHGPYECLLNTVEACAIDEWPELNVHFPFIYCIESFVHEHKRTEWENCFEKLDLDPKPITDCYTGERGKKLELQYAAETEALQPPHQYVPWVVVDGQPLYEDYENFLSYICKAYKGVAVPKACREQSLDTIRTRKSKPRRPVCYKEEKSALSARIRSTIGSWMQKMNMGALL